MKSRRKFSSVFKSKVALEAIREQSSLSELSEKYELEVSQISKWKREFMDKSSLVFDIEKPKKTTEKETQKLYEKIGRLEVQIDFLKKIVEKHGVQSRKSMVEIRHKRLSIMEQCVLLSISHSGYYYTPVAESERNLSIMKVIDKIHTEYPFYGFRRIRKELENHGFFIGKKLVIRLMKLMSIHTVYPKPKTTVPSSEHTVYPCLLRDLAIEKVNRVWEMDITYIAMEKGFMYLLAIMDVYSRYVLHRDISNTMEASWCKDIVEQAIVKNGTPEIFNTDQGSQFTGELFTSYLLANKIKISMDGRGRATDNIYTERLWRSVKQEKIYLNAYETGYELYRGLKVYFDFYNRKRPHQSLDYACPLTIYKKVYDVKKNTVFASGKKKKTFQEGVVFTTSSEKKCYKKFV